MVIPNLRPLRVLPFLLLGSCASEAATTAWSGTERDSAGIRIVENPDQPLWGDDDRWDVTTVLDIGTTEGDPDYQFGEVEGVTVDRDGQIYVLDDLTQQVKVYSPEGQFERTIGRRGNGPGELNGAAWLWITSDTLMVVDMGNIRVNRYELDGSDAGSFPMRFERSIATDFVTDERGRIIHTTQLTDGSAGNTEWVVVRTPAGEVTDTLLTYASSDAFDFDERGPKLTVFSPETMWTMAPGPSILFGNSHNYRITRFDPAGEPDLIVTRAAVGETITPSDANAYTKAMVKLWEGRLPQQFHSTLRDRVTFAEQFPIFTSLHSGPDGTIWVQRFENIAATSGIDESGFSPEYDVGAKEWDVFDATGRFLGVVEMPSRFTAFQFVGEEIYGVQRDELDVQHVLKLSLNRSISSGS